MAVTIGRRELLAALGGAAAAWPLAARAQQPIPVVGFLSGRSPGEAKSIVEAFRKGLSAAGYDEGRNVTVEYRWAESQLDRLPTLAGELVRRPVALLVATGGDQSVDAAKAATATIPIVFLYGANPVGVGLVASLSRPGGNATGVTILGTDLEAKRLQLLHEMIPGANVIAALVFNNPRAELQAREIEEAGRALGLRMHVFYGGSERDLDAAFATAAQRRAGALFVAADVLATSYRNALIALAARHRLPAMYHQRELPAAGGLVSYGTSIPDMDRQVGVYAGRILKGEKPADLPVLQPTKFDLVINLKTAKALGLVIPEKLLALADEVIE
jgi:putative tryptophan/tyrosine transport system substrate-binding protein